MPDQPSEKYYRALALTKNHHDSQNKTFSGQFTWKNKHRIKALIDEYGVKTLLDYGCGKGKQYENVDEENGQTLEQYWGLSPFKYDPGVAHYRTEPTGKFDMVICVQVLGSIPKDDLPWVIDRLYNFATKVIFVSERLIEPRKKIYDEMRGDMPYGMSREEWVNMLGRPNVEMPKMVLALKSPLFRKGWNVEIVT